MTHTFLQIGTVFNGIFRRVKTHLIARVRQLLGNRDSPCKEQMVDGVRCSDPLNIVSYDCQAGPGIENFNLKLNL